MGSTNHGTQDIIYQYFLEATAENWGKRLLDIHVTGIYSGCHIGITGGLSLYLNPMVVEIRDATNQVCIRTSDNAIINNATLDSGSMNSATPYLVLRWAHTSSAANYLEVHAIASLSARSQYDLVIGKMEFTGGALTGFDYADRSHPRTPGVELRVEPLLAPNMNLLVRGGRYPIGSTNFPVQETQIGPFIAPAAPYSRIDLVYMEDEVPTILQGTPSVSPVAPDYGGRLVLAEVRLVNADTAITWDRITDVRPSVFPTTIPDGAVTVEKLHRYDSGWFPVTKNVLYTKTHGLGSEPNIVLCYLAQNFDGSGNRASANGSNDQGYDGFDADGAGTTDFHSRGTTICSVNSTTLSIRTGHTAVAAVRNSTGALWSPTDAYARIIALA